MDEPASAAALAAAVAAIGEPSFPDALLAALRSLAGTDLCSAFERGGRGGLSLLFAAGRHAEIPDFAESASLAYARDYWRRDRATQRALAQAGGPVQLVRQAWNGIADPDYRRICYERGGIVERLTLYGGAGSALFASAYRTRDSGPSSPAEVERLERAGGLIMAMVGKHAAIVRRAGQGAPPPLHEVARRLRECGRALSEREAAVAAGLLLGRTQKEISEATGVAVSSVITYRRRAYRKLEVSDRRALGAFLRQLDSTH